MKHKVLFVCRHNSARSQMAEAFLNELGRDRFAAESAGLNPGEILPPVAEVMREIGIDVSNNPTSNVAELHRNGARYDFVVTVCDEESAKECPTFADPCRHLHWTFAEPSKFMGNREEIIDQTRIVRDQIRAKIVQWIDGF